jgi:hypothetical protein
MTGANAPSQRNNHALSEPPRCARVVGCYRRTRAPRLPAAIALLVATPKLAARNSHRFAQPWRADSVPARERLITATASWRGLLPLRKSCFMIPLSRPNERHSRGRVNRGQDHLSPKQDWHRDGLAHSECASIFDPLDRDKTREAPTQRCEKDGMRKTETQKAQA